MESFDLFVSHETSALPLPPPLSGNGQGIALLAPGPSIRSTWNNELFDSFRLVVAINTCAIHFRCHWIAGMDAKIYRELWKKKELPLIGAIAGGRTIMADCRKRHLRIVAPPLQGDAFRAQMRSQGRQLPPNTVSASYTMPNAIAFCLGQLAPGEGIEVFGMDFTGDRLDAFGMRGCHINDRWRKEAAWLRFVWDARRIRVHGAISKDRLAFIESKSEVFA